MACSLLGATETICLTQSSLVQRIYQQERVTERFNCSYSLNEAYREAFQRSALQFSGTNRDGAVRIVELPEHPFFLAMLFQPQLSSSAASPHPVIVAYLQAAKAFAD